MLGAARPLSGGMSEAALGVYWLTRDTEHPGLAALEQARTAEAQGDLYALSIRPFLVPGSLTLLGTAPGPDDTTDYTVRFRHPYALPVDFNPPATASKRFDLFLFDVNLVLALSGSDSFFGGTLRTHLNAMPAPSGFRQLGPFVNLAALGVGAGTNVFPYQLVAQLNEAAPAGNYDPQEGWTGNEWFASTGYDVVPQGAEIDTILRVSNAVPVTVPVVVMAKYMDPRAGATTAQKRASRLPNATDPTQCRYFLPEACGDLQRITTMQSGVLAHTTSTEIVTLTATVLDWDNAATRALVFPNHSNLTQVAEESQPMAAEASFPQLFAGGVYPGTLGATPAGVLNELRTLTFEITNVDRAVQPPAGESVEVPGLLRIRDRQDTTNPVQIFLDEQQLPQPAPPGFEPSTRYQKATVRVTNGTAPPVLTAVDPEGGITGTLLEFGATQTGGPITSWSWDFGGGASPNTSTAANPVVLLNAVGTYSASVSAFNAAGSDTFPFLLQVTPPPVLVITGVAPPEGPALRPASFAITTSGGTPTSWSWNFGGGAVPNTSTDPMPLVTLGLAGTYNGTVSASNASGSSVPYPFTLTVENKKIGLRWVVVTNGPTHPGLLQGLPDWSAASVWTWVNTYVNPVYVSTGVEFDPDLFEYATLDYPAIFNVDTGTEHNWLMAVIFDQPGDKLNFYVVNSAPWYPNLGGVAGDKNCSPDNDGRGCYIVALNAINDIKDAAHELGHVMNLPHIKTSLPVTPLNNNLMSYYTQDVSLSGDISAVEPFTFCWLWASNPMNQNLVTNNWCWANLP